MRFIDKLNHNAVAEWSKFYIDYEALKHLLFPEDIQPSAGLTLYLKRLSIKTPSHAPNDHEAEDKHESSILDETRVASMLFGSVHKAASGKGADFATDCEFRSLLLQEVCKVERFFARTLKELEDQYAMLSEQSVATAAMERRDIEAKKEQQRTIRLSIPQSIATRLSSSHEPSTFQSPSNNPLSGSPPVQEGGGEQSAIEFNEFSGQRDLAVRFISEDLTSVRGAKRTIRRKRGSIRDGTESMRPAPSTNEVLALQSAKRAYLDLHRSIRQLKDFGLLNYTAIVKICQKRDEALLETSDASTTTPPASSDGTSFLRTSTFAPTEAAGDGTSARENELGATGEGSSTVNPLHRLTPLCTPEFLAQLQRDAAFAHPNGARQLCELAERLCALFAVVFCGGSREIASVELFTKRRAQERAEAASSNSGTGARTFRLGFRLGCCLLLAAWIAWDVGIDFALLSHSQQLATHGTCHKTKRLRHTKVMAVWMQADFPVYRGMLTLALALWCWGGVMWVLGRCRVNYLYIFGLDPRTTGSPTETIWEASTVTIVLLASFIIHFKVVRCEFPPDPIPLGVWPIVPLVVMGFRAVRPWVFRKFAWVALWGVVRSPCVSVTFIHNFCGDVLTSLVKPLVDVAYSACFFTTGDFLKPLGSDLVCDDPNRAFKLVITPVIIIAPYWFRLMQCMRRYMDGGSRWPHLPNALKYALAMIVTVFGTFQADLSAQNRFTVFQTIWRSFYVISTLYSWLWDVFMDWSLFKIPGSALQEDEPLLQLRHRRMLSSGPGLYYAAAAIDLVLRFAWGYTLIPTENQKDFSTLGREIAPFTATAEVLRRSMWAVLRLENEHLHNTEGYRESNRIPLHYDKLESSPAPSSVAGAKTRPMLLFEVLFYTGVVVALSAIAIINRDVDDIAGGSDSGEAQ